MSIGETLRKLRTDKNLTLEEVGKKLKVGKSTIANYERDYRTPDVYTVKKLASIYEVSVDHILGLDDDSVQALQGDEIPKELKNLGVQEIGIAQTLAESGLSKEDLEKLIDIVKKLK